MRIKKEQKEEIERRIKLLRNGKPLPEIKARVVILIDDGLAMGSTMRASIMICRKRKAKKIVVAVPVAGKGVNADMEQLADEVVVLEMPEPFYADAYREWHDVSDEEALEILKKWKR
ncbi:MAG: phosphoribosyltransferase family protein [Nanoarchaeota archaeon]|nr:phosphoribosyltransferase family protein [Nanoarchaeota archaeon]